VLGYLAQFARSDRLAPLAMLGAALIAVLALYGGFKEATGRHEPGHKVSTAPETTRFRAPSTQGLLHLFALPAPI
jgi:hypothetical protein